MGLHEIKPAPGSRSARRRIGRGDGSGRGSFSGRGLKGQKARGSISPVFEGGQLPLVKRLPYMRGFHNPFRVSYTAVNLSRLEAFEAQAEITPETLREAGIVRKGGDLVKILGGGDLNKPLKVTAHAFSKAAKERIEAAGGTATVIATGKAAGVAS